MKIAVRNIAQLHFADYNPRRMSKQQRAEIKKSLKKFGFAVPIVVNVHPERKNIVVGGHQRLIVAKELKIKEVPTVEVSLPLDRERELNLRLNKNNGEWDPKKLEENFDIEELLNAGFVKKDLDFNVTELVDRSPTKTKKPRANVEVMFQLGELRFTLSQETYTGWMDSLAHKVGMKKEKQIAEVMKRLQIASKHKKGGKKK